MITRVNGRVFEYYPQLQRVDDYVQQHLSQPIAMPHIAAAVGMAPKYFSTFFHDKTGMTFREYLCRMRVEKSLALINAGDVQLTAVALDVGFGSVRSFERAFRKATGLRPIEFKQQVRALLNEPGPRPSDENRREWRRAASK